MKKGGHKAPLEKGKMKKVLINLDGSDVVVEEGA